MGEKLTGQDILDAGLADWRLLLRSLHTRYATHGFDKGLALVDAIGAVAEEMDHHPDIDLRWPHVTIALTSHDVGAVTDRDVRLARRISEIAAEQGLTARPHEVKLLEAALDTPDFAGVKPFWRAVLGLRDSPTLPDELSDAGGSLPTLWFQKSDPFPEGEQRQRFHFDIHVPHDIAEQRVAAVLEAGGRLVSADAAPSFWVLADAEGNKACVCTWQPSAQPDG